MSLVVRYDVTGPDEAIIGKKLRRNKMKKIYDEAREAMERAWYTTCEPNKFETEFIAMVYRFNGIQK